MALTTLGKPVRESITEMTEIVMPNDANVYGTIFGGRLLQWIDVIGAIAAGRHCRQTVVTASIDRVDFTQPIRLGDVVRLRASVNWTGRSSMEVGVQITAENLRTGEVRHTNTAYLTFVAVDTEGRPVPVPPVIPETEEERRRWDGAVRRRELRLAAGKPRGEEPTRVTG